jgi:hypothetical protein
MSARMNLRSPRGPMRYVSSIPRSLQRLKVLVWTWSRSEVSRTVSIEGRSSTNVVFSYAIATTFLLLLVYLSYLNLHY